MKTTFAGPAVTFGGEEADGETKAERAELDRLLSLTETGRSVLAKRGLTREQIETLRTSPNPATFSRTLKGKLAAARPDDPNRPLTREELDQAAVWAGVGR